MASDSFHAVALTSTAELAEQLRDRLAAVLVQSSDDGLVERVVIGRGADEADKLTRLRIVPLPSIGSEYADHSIRRVLIEMPPNCPIPVREIEWAAYSIPVTSDSSLVNDDQDGMQFVNATDRSMLTHYGINHSRDSVARVWRTVTPAVLRTTRRLRTRTGHGRAAFDAVAGHAVRQALRHTGVFAQVDAVRVQREPFEQRGAQAEQFEVPARFSGRILRHVEIAFAQAQPGPIVIGDGRYLGLGLMRPDRNLLPGIVAFDIATPRIAVADSFHVVSSMRRALMALSRDDRGRVPQLFSGHEPNGDPARSGHHEHVFIVADDSDGDGYLDRIIVAAPWCCDRRSTSFRRKRLEFERTVTRLTTVRAGRSGVIMLHPAVPLLAEDALLGPGQTWESRSPYYPTLLSGLRKDAREVIKLDLANECVRRGLPRPEVDILSLAAHPTGRGLVARACLRFKVAVKGPLFLGYESHSGSGVFSVTD